MKSGTCSVIATFTNGDASENVEAHSFASPTWAGVKRTDMRARV